MLQLSDTFVVAPAPRGAAIPRWRRQTSYRRRGCWRLSLDDPAQYSTYVDEAERLRLTRRHADAQASRSGCRIGGEDDTATGAPISVR